MQLERVELPNLSDLRRFVSHTLCQRSDIEVGVFRVTERVLYRQGRPCGMFFCLHGPRSVKLTAVWETDKNTILFYGSTGEKFQKTLLQTAPEIAATSTSSFIPLYCA
jgi:hypothetical protein